ncbi:type 1 glutamine amidotransferase [Halotalea alkalilenta]|uniref:type 1 glutamine amidotransferase n=1 Tax=Halotalea alkalilenta TaxID=376489 RepID=UPI000486C7CE|nr:type 1 glutamine amidotransferase [Halotalea alkalilenta]
MHVYFLQHHPDYGPARISDWLTGMGHSYNICRLYHDEMPPKLADFDALVVLDGPDSALDEAPYPNIKRERKLIERTLASAKPLMGIGYGGCLIAQSLGAIVSPGTFAELGWHGVVRAPACRLPLPERFDAFHWHREIFGLPQEAHPVGSTTASPIQGFSWDDERVIALLFHLEATATSAQAIAEVALECVGGDEPGGFIQSRGEMFEATRRFDRLAPMLDRVMMAWLRLG